MNNLNNNQDYGVIPIDLLRDSDISASAKIVWIAVQKSCANGKHYSLSGINKLKNGTGFARSTIQRSLDDLKKAGYIIEKSRGKGKTPKRYPVCFLTNIKSLNESIDSSNGKTVLDEILIELPSEFTRKDFINKVAENTTYSYQHAQNLLNKSQYDGKVCRTEHGLYKNQSSN